MNEVCREAILSQFCSVKQSGSRRRSHSPHGILSGIVRVGESRVGESDDRFRENTVTNMASSTTLSDASARPPASPAATLIYDDWYAAMRSDRLHAGQTAVATLLGIQLLLGRTREGELFAMRDSCPHRGIPLSFGSFDSAQITCKYHGWKFDAVSGQCKEIPSLTPEDTLDCSRIYATAFPCVERDGTAWVYVPAPGSGRVFDRRIWRRSYLATSIMASSA